MDLQEIKDMGWTIVSLLIMLGIGIPVLNYIYQGFLNTTNGTWMNWTITDTTTGCATVPYSTFEIGMFRFIPLLAALMVIMFILMLISGRLKKDEQNT